MKVFKTAGDARDGLLLDGARSEERGERQDRLQCPQVIVRTAFGRRLGFEGEQHCAQLACNGCQCGELICSQVLPENFPLSPSYAPA